MFAEDLTPFFNATEFASDALLDSVSVTGIFEKKYVSAGSGLGIESTQPAMILPAGSVGPAPVGQLLFYGDTAYRVAGIDEDGSDNSVVVLLLELA
ncbi:MAG: hypothetical protein M3Y65_16350 [Pseudomonadota bacterium]|nr:hypothetical protein [Pseudomonadota bacterium]